jgi:hypothetical protein
VWLGFVKKGKVGMDGLKMRAAVKRRGGEQVGRIRLGEIR